MSGELIGKILGFLVIAAVVLGLPYLAGAFILWNFNPGNWDTGARSVCIFGQVFMSGLVTMVLTHDGSPYRRD